jgi:putative transposase
MWKTSLHERGIEISHETVRFWWNRFGPMFAAEIRRKRIDRMRAFSNWRWHVDELFVKINGEHRYLWRAVDHEGEVLEAVVTKRRDKSAALKLLSKLVKRYGRPKAIVTDRLPSYGAALQALGAKDLQATGRWLNNRVENSHLPLRRRERAMLRFRRTRSLQKSPPFTPPSTISSTRTAAFQDEAISNSTPPQLLRSGGSSAKPKFLHPRPNGDWFPFV